MNEKISRMKTTVFYRLIAKRLLLPFLLMAAAVPLACGQPGALTPALVETVQGCTSIGGFHENISVVCKNGRYGYIRRDGGWVVRPKYDMAFDFSEGRGAVVKNGRLGFVDSTGREVIACRYYYGGWFDPYNYYNHFNCGLAVLLLNGNFGAIDRTGKVRIPFGCFDKIYHFDNGVAFAREKGGKMVIIDTNGNIGYRLPDSLKFDYPYRSGKRCLAALLSSDASDTCGLIDTKGVVLMPPRPGRFTYLNEDRTILLHFYSHCDMISWDRDSCYTIYNYVYDLVRQRELAFDTMEIKRLLELNQLMPSYSEGKCFVKKEVDGKKRVVVQDSSGQELWTLPLGVYDFQPWSEGFSVVRLKDGQHLSCGLMDAAGRLSFTAEQLREAERIANWKMPSWPVQHLDSQTVAGLAQLLEEAYQEQSKEKKQLFYQRCAELSKSCRRTDNDTLREVEDLFKVLYLSGDWSFRGLGNRLESGLFFQSSTPHLCYQANLEKLMELLQRNLGGDKVSLYDIYQFLNLNIATNRTEQEAVVQSADDYRSVLCMTVHKSKGLEFDTIILPYTNRTFSTKEQTEILVDPVSCQVGWYFTDSNRRETRQKKYNEMQNDLYDELKEKDIQAEIREECRILYVAMTRAIDSLICIVPEPRNDRTWAFLLSAL